MKKIIVFLAITASFYANARNLSAMAWSFTAPSLSDPDAISPKTAGDIVFDTTTANFYGWDGSSYLTLSGKVATAPTVQKFTTSGTATYTLPTNPAPLYIKVRMVGGGGGGGGSSTGGPTAGGNGYNTTFGTSLLVANGGSGGSTSGVGGAGGSASLGSGPVGLAISGGSGGGSMVTSTTQASGGVGGNSAFGGSGGSGTISAGLAAATNSGSGGGGAGIGISSYVGAGGGAGGYVEAIIYNPSSTYSYAVGGGGSAGSAGSGGAAGGAGGTGIIIVEEYYQ
ncbi:hypothetical protein [Pseudobdellovibrio sp. HCB154]|uniref:hypothetical protein n=1 Tax=Pseudobdellovibrio sp. HCB154 TaxID=3386277 RepID=UPI0039170C29